MKLWYGCVINKLCTLSDVYTEFRSDKIDGSLPLPDEYLGTAVEAFVGPKKIELTHVNCECTVGDTISTLGQYVEYSVSTLPVDSMCTETDTRVDAMAILMRGALQRSHLPDKWQMNSPNKKLKLKNDILDWLQTN